MIRKSILVCTLFATATAQAEVIRTQCQTEESRGLRYASRAMYQAAEESNPWAGCESGCQMATSVAESMQATQMRFKAEGRADILKARAAEATKCPDIAEAIMSLGPATDEEKSAVKAKYDRIMKESADAFEATKAWRAAHPQCKDLRSDLCFSNGRDCITKENLSGNGGVCVLDGHSKLLNGTEEDLKMYYNPETSPSLARVACRDALKASNLGDGGDADPKLCEADK